MCTGDILQSNTGSFTRTSSLRIVTIFSSDSIALGCVECMGAHNYHFYHMTSLFCSLIGMWKFLSGGPRILPKFTRPFSRRGWGLGMRLDGRVHSASTRLLFLAAASMELARVSPCSMTFFFHVDGASRVLLIWHTFVHVYRAYCCQLYSTSFVDVLSQPRLPSFKRILPHSFLYELAVRAVDYICKLKSLYIVLSLLHVCRDIHV